MDIDKNKFELDMKDFEEDRYSRLKLIEWWDQERLVNATIMVVGAGAIGNELVKNLSLLGVGRIIIVDMDRIEQTNLTRSVLFRDSDVERYKSEVACERAKEINSDIKVINLNSNIITDVGLGVFKDVDIVLGGLDNREARLAINQACWKVNTPWIDGAIEVLNGFVRVFIPPDGACYECTMTENDWKLIKNRKSCALISKDQILEGKIPTTPTSSSVIAGIQVQEMLKMLHDDRKLPFLGGKCFVFNGLTHDSFVVEYQRKSDCMSHDTYFNIIKKDWSVMETSIRELYLQAQNDLGEGVILEFDRDIAINAECSCGAKKDLFIQVNKLNFDDMVCPKCNATMSFESMHSIKGNESFLDKTLKELDIPLYHIIGARNKSTYIYYEFSKDRSKILREFL